MTIIVAAVVVGAAALTGTVLLTKKSKLEEKFNFFIPERDTTLGPSPTDAVVEKAENALSFQNKKVKINFFQYPLMNHLNKNNIDFSAVDAGIVNALELITLRYKGLKLRPLYSISPHVKFECNSELQVIVNKNSKITSLKDLKGKNVAVIIRATRSFGLLSNELIEGHIKFENIYIRKPFFWAMESLRSKKVDAMIIPVTTLSNGYLSSKLGSFFQGQYEKEPDLKVIKTTKNVVPCRVLFVRQTMEQQLQKNFILNLNKIFNESGNIMVMRDLTLAGSIKALTQQQWKTIVNVLKNDTSSANSFNQFANKVIEE